MAVTPEQYESIKRWRDFYFRSSEGREKLMELLTGLGLFVPMDDMSERLVHPGAVALFQAGLEILRKLGIWRTDMFDKLIEAMAAMPMPLIIDQEQGETKG